MARHWGGSGCGLLCVPFLGPPIRGWLRGSVVCAGGWLGSWISSPFGPGLPRTSTPFEFCAQIAARVQMGYPALHCFGEWHSSGGGVSHATLELHGLQTQRKPGNPWNLFRTPVRPFAFGRHRSIGRLRLSEPNLSVSVVDLCQYPTLSNHHEHLNT